MKRRTARKVIKYGMEEVRGRYGTYLKAIQVCPQLSNLLHFKKVMKDLRNIYDGAARPAHQQADGRIYPIGTPDGTATIADGTKLLAEIKGRTITYGPKGIGKSRLSSSIWD